MVDGREVGVEPICAVLKDAGMQIAPSSYYATKTRPPSARSVRDAELVDLGPGPGPTAGLDWQLDQPVPGSAPPQTVRARLDAAPSGSVIPLRAALADLAAAAGPPLDRAVRDTLGVTTHRLDAWVTACATARLADLLVARLPEGPVLYPDGELTDEPEQVLIGELIREAALEGVRDELPHSIAVTVEEMHLREDRPEDKPLLDVYATLHVERDSQKAIILGKGGQRIKQIGAAARTELEEMMERRVHLFLHVKVREEWTNDPERYRDWNLDYNA